MKMKIGFSDLQIRCVIGVHQYEREKEQDLFLDLQVDADLEKCTRSDRIQDTVDYDEIAMHCQKLAIEGKFQLIETYAKVLVETLLEKFSLRGVWLKVKKPEALQKAEYAFVEYEKKVDS